MPKARSNSEEVYARLAQHFLNEKGVSQGDKFGKGLRYEDKVFAMLVRGELVVKLPENEVTKLVQKKTGRAFMHGKKVMKEWLVVAGADFPVWKKIATQALKAAQS